MIQIWLIFFRPSHKITKDKFQREVQMKRLTQREALEMGLARFYTGKKCIHGHDSERYTLSGECVKCNNERARRQQQLRSEKMKINKLARETAQ